MAKRILEDMNVKVRREAHKKVWDEVVRSKPTPKMEALVEEEMPLVTSKPLNKKNSRHRLWFVAGASVVFLFFSLSVFFSGATLSVGPKVEELALNQNFSAIKNGTTPALSFDLMSISDEEVKEVLGGEEVVVSKKATGLVKIFNKFSSATQRLDVDTRLEGSNGKIYKTKKQVVVPGMKGATAGSVEVEIYANEAGEASNSGPLDFTILGFKGTSKYSKFSARSVGDITGGFVGKERVIDEAQKTLVLTELKTALEAKLLQKATDQIPAGFILFKDATQIVIDEEAFKSTEGSLVEVSVKGTLHGVLFEEKKLTDKIVEKKFPEEVGNDIYIKNIKDLKFSHNKEEGSASFANMESMNFNLSGATVAVWRVDEEKLMQDVLGQKKGNINQLLAVHQNITSASISVRPFWKMSLPKNAKDIKILVAYP